MDKIRHTNKIFYDTSKSYVEWYFHSAKFWDMMGSNYSCQRWSYPKQRIAFLLLPVIIKNNVASQPRAILIIIAPLVVAQLT